MKNLYFDMDKISKILAHYDTDPYGTIIRFEQYFEEYPKDYSVYPYYCSELIKIGEYEKAEKMLDKVDKEYKEDPKYISLDKRKIFEANLILSKIKLLFYTYRYSKCLHLAKKHLVFLQNHQISVNRLTIYLEKKLGITKLKRSDNYQYSYNQIIEYSEKEFLEHIKKHQYEYVSEEEFLEQKVFAKDFKLDKVFEVIKKDIPNGNRLNNGLFDNTYYYKYDGCGTVLGKKVDYFLVLTHNNSQEFITMYPCDIGPKVPYTDLNYLLLEEKPKTLKKSRIDRFNEKYGINVDKK